MGALVIEDNLVSQAICEAFLEKLDIEPFFAATGKEAYIQLENNSNVIQLIILDIMLPDISGLDLLYEFKNHPEWKSIPVIMCTGKSELATVRKAIELGCVHYVVKPISESAILPKICQLTGLNEKQKEMRACKNIQQILLNPDYKNAGRKYLMIVRNQIKILENQDFGNTTEALIRSLGELKEGAALLGAKRVNSLVDNITATGVTASNVINDDYLLLLGELKKCETILSAVLFTGDEHESEVTELLHSIEGNTEEALAGLDELIDKQKARGIDVIRISQMEPGMTACENIYAENHALLVAKDQIITDKILDKLKEYQLNIGVIEPVSVMKKTKK